MGLVTYLVDSERYKQTNDLGRERSGSFVSTEHLEIPIIDELEKTVRVRL